MRNKGLGVLGLLIIVALVGGIYYGWQFGYQKVVNLVNQRQAIGFMKEDIAYMVHFINNMVVMLMMMEIGLYYPKLV